VWVNNVPPVFDNLRDADDVLQAHDNVQQVLDNKLTTLVEDKQPNDVLNF
jgi:hypothetical protein